MTGPVSPVRGPSFHFWPNVSPHKLFSHRCRQIPALFRCHVKVWVYSQGFGLGFGQFLQKLLCIAECRPVHITKRPVWLHNDERYPCAPRTYSVISPRDIKVESTFEKSNSIRTRIIAQGKRGNERRFRHQFECIIRWTRKTTTSRHGERIRHDAMHSNSQRVFANGRMITATRLR